MNDSDIGLCGCWFILAGTFVFLALAIYIGTALLMRFEPIIIQVWNWIAGI